ncbi:hypothetical protein N9936_02090, partial [bacterium]|nr:hypothetical protein [bacterium]
TFDSVAMNQGGIKLERIRNGRTNGATHRMVWFWTLGEDLMAEDAMSDDKSSLLWARMGNYVEEWQASYSGRVTSWQAGKEENATMHIWDVKIEDPNVFKAGHEKIVKEFKKDFEGRSIGFGTYDFGRPNGATHWIALTGKDREDHMMLYEKLWNDKNFVKLIKERGPVESVKDYEVRVLKQYQ